MIERAAKTPCRIALPEAVSEPVLKLAEAVVAAGVGTPVLVGSKAAVLAAIERARVDATGFDYFDIDDEAATDELSERYRSLHDDFSPKALARRMRDPLLCAMLLVKAQVVDAVAAGKELSTGEVVAAAMQIVGLAPGVRCPSSLGIADVPGFQGPEGSMLALADCAITAQPDAEELAGIAAASADTVRTLLGWEPRVAMLSFSTCGSAEHETIEVVREAVRLVSERRPDVACDGEFQLDTAIVARVAERKVPRESGLATLYGTLSRGIEIHEKGSSGMADPRRPRKFSEEFKRQIVQLYDNGKPVSEIGAEYDLSHSTVHRWIKSIHGSGSTRAADNRTPEQQRILELEKENKQLRMEVDVLKTAALIFARK
jgi:phosphate acetyltransferase